MRPTRGGATESRAQGARWRTTTFFFHKPLFAQDSPALSRNLPTEANAFVFPPANSRRCNIRVQGNNDVVNVLDVGANEARNTLRVLVCGPDGEASSGVKVVLRIDDEKDGALAALGPVIHVWTKRLLYRLRRLRTSLPLRARGGGEGQNGASAQVAQRGGGVGLGFFLLPRRIHGLLGEMARKAWSGGKSCDSEAGSSARIHSRKQPEGEADTAALQHSSRPPTEPEAPMALNPDRFNLKNLSGLHGEGSQSTASFSDPHRPPTLPLSSSRQTHG